MAAPHATTTGEPVTPSSPQTGAGQTAPAEVTGVRSLVAYLDDVAAKHAGYAGDEGFIGSLNRMEVGTDDQQLVAEAQQSSRDAAALWADAAASVRANNMPVNEQYTLNPQAGNKDANTNE